jgi:hypothetical protein
MIGNHLFHTEICQDNKHVSALLLIIERLF